MKQIKGSIPILSLLLLTALILGYDFFIKKEPVPEKEKKGKSLSVVENDVVILTLTFPEGEGDILTFESLGKVRTLHRMLDDMEGIKSIASVVVATVVTAEGDEIAVRPFIDPGLFDSRDDARLQKLRGDFLRYPELEPYISRDLRSCSFYIEPGIHYSSASLYKQLEGIQSYFREKTGLGFDFTGLRPITVLIEKYMTADILYFLPVVFILITLILLLNFSSLRVVGISYLVIAAASAFSCSAALAFNLKVTPLIVLIPAFNAGLLTDYLIHFFYHVRGLGKRADINGARDRLVMPLLLTGLSTVIGFLSMMFLSSDGHQFLGLVIALCIAATYLLTVLWLPPVSVGIAPDSRPVVFRRKERIVELARAPLFALFDVLSRRKWAVYLVCGAVMIASIFLIPRIVIQPYPVHQIPEDSTVRRAEAVLNERFAGTIPFTLQFDTGKDQSLLQRKNIDFIENVHHELAKDRDVGYAWSLLTVIKRINYYFNSADPAQLRIPDIKDEFRFQSLIEQYLIFYSTTARPEEYEMLVDPGYRLCSVNGLLRYSSHESLDRFMKTAEKMRSSIPPSWKIEIRGPLRQLLDQADNLRYNWIFSFAMSISMIFLMVLVFYRSLSLSLISMFPSLISVVITTGFIAAFNIEIDIYTIIFIAITMGLTIDYTIHVIVAIQQLKKQENAEALCSEDRDVAASYLSFILNYSGLPVFLSFLTSLVSFGILMLSSFQGARNFGLIISLSLVISIFFSVLVLPALLIGRRRKGG